MLHPFLAASPGSTQEEWLQVSIEDILGHLCRNDLTVLFQKIRVTLSRFGGSDLEETCNNCRTLALNSS